MIYVLLANGASVIPQFLPGVPQLLLLLWMLWILLNQRFRPSLPVATIIACLIFMITSSLAANVPEEGFRLIKLLINAIVSAVVATGIEHRYKGQFAEVYSKAILNLTLIGTAGLVLAAINSWSISSSIGDRHYHTNLLTTWLIDGDFESSQTLFSPLPYRLQAMFDEPGTFGMLLVPAFFHCVHRGKARAAALLLLGAFLSESANAWLLCSLILVAKTWTVRSVLGKLMVWAILLAALAIAWPTLVQLYEIKAGLDEAYENVSSFGVRSAEYGYLDKAWVTHLVPFQNREIINLFPDGISVAYISWYIVGGLLFVIMLIPVLTTFTIKLLRNWGSSDPDHYFALVLGATLLLSGFQRSSFLDNVLFMSLTFWALIHRPRYL